MDPDVVTVTRDHVAGSALMVTFLSIPVAFLVAAWLARDGKPIRMDHGDAWALLVATVLVASCAVGYFVLRR